jgi:hypothetical protein
MTVYLYKQKTIIKMSDPKIISLQKYKKSQKLKSFKEKLLKIGRIEKCYL